VTLSTRLTLWYSLVLCAVLAITGAAVFAEHRRLELGFLDRDLATYADSVTRIVNDDLDDGVSLSAAAHHAVRELSFPGRMLVIIDAKGQPLVSTTPGGVALPIADGGITTGTPQASWRMMRLTVRRGLEQYAVVAGDPLGAFRQRALRLQRAFFVGVPVAVVLAAVGGWWLVRIGLRPAGLLAAQAERASEAQRVRLDVPDPNDEFGRVATSFNGLLERLDRARDAERQLMADASHELRTPVSIARTAAEVTLSQPSRTEQEYRESLGIIAEQARRLAQMVDGMFVLARADAGGQTLVDGAFYLDELAHECVRGVSVVARTRQVDVSCAATEDLHFRGDEGLVRRLMVNLLQNAVEHAPSGGHVSLAVEGRDESIVIRVTDNGPGIPMADRERVFGRFVRLPGGTRTQGAGLGLPIARWITEAHGGRLVLVTADPGCTVFEAVLPSNPAGPSPPPSAA